MGNTSPQFYTRDESVIIKAQEQLAARQLESTILLQERAAAQQLAKEVHHRDSQAWIDHFCHLDCFAFKFSVAYFLLCQRSSWKYFRPLYAVSAAGIAGNAIYSQNPRSLVWLIPLAWVGSYQYHSAYLQNTRDINLEAEQILRRERHLLRVRPFLFGQHEPSAATILIAVRDGEAPVAPAPINTKDDTVDQAVFLD